MTLNDEFLNYDTCTADTLQIGDLIFLQDQFVEVHTIEDNDLITVFGYSYSEDDEVELDPVDAGTIINLYQIA